ncbi:acyltransferase family protein [Kitasatospora sp. NPDC101801]|uniref:acyltransferase family protein n=1 Tax=Kitasatospora sp. NPDC101801 TaxID=3364103 RepID=UPI0038043DA6
MSLTTQAPAPEIPEGRAKLASDSAKPRLGWLDALRGFAALAIMIGHFVQNVMPEEFARTAGKFDIGTYAVFLFFLVSGYIVPASLERRGSVRGFWISRLFRIYPLCLAVVALGAVVWKLGGYTDSLPPLGWFTMDHPAIAALGNVTMLHDFLGVGGTVFVMWTLSYEMIFYLLVASLFVLGVHRRSAELSTAFSLVALLAVGAFPLYTITHDLPGLRRAVVLATVVMAVGLFAVMSRRRSLAVLGAVVLGALALGLLVANSRMPGWFSMTILATMFAGTAIYRVEQGQTGWVKCAVAAVVGIPALLYVGGRYGEHGEVTPEFQWHWVTTMVATWATFAIGMALRRFRMPKALTWLGSISYSVYLVHAVLLSVLLWLITPTPVTSLSLGTRVVLGVGFCAVVLAVSHLTFHLIERPAQRLGSRLTKAVERRSAKPAGTPE